MPGRESVREVRINGIILLRVDQRLHLICENEPIRRVCDSMHVRVGHFLVQIILMHSVDKSKMKKKKLIYFRLINEFKVVSPIEVASDVHDAQDTVDSRF